MILQTAPRTASALRSLDIYDYIVPIYIASSAGLLANLFVPTGPTAIVDGTSALFIAAWVVVWGLSLLGLRGAPVYSPNSLPEILIPLLILYMIASAAWSTNPAKSATYGIVVVLNYVFAVLAIQRLGFARTMKLVALTLIALSAIGLFLGLIALPNALYIDTHNRPNLLGLHPIRGLSNHKITSGIYAAIGALSSLIYLRKWRLIGFLLCTSMVVMSGSSAAIAIQAALLAALFLFRGSSLRASLRWPIIIYSTATGALLAIRFGPELLELLGRDPTLTGRTILWQFGLRALSERPAFGWGYLGYLGSYQFSNALLDYRKMANYDIPHFHNSYIGLSVELGLAGLFTFLTSLVLTVTRAFNSTTTASHFAATVLIVYIGYAFVTNTFMRYNDFSTIFFMLCAVGLSQAARGPAGTLSEPTIARG